MVSTQFLQKGRMLNNDHATLPQCHNNLKAHSNTNHGYNDRHANSTTAPKNPLPETHPSNDRVLESKQGGRTAPYPTLPEVTVAMSHAMLPVWPSVLLTLTLIFGGCCANVFALEAIIKEEPRAGPLITFVQFIITALFTAPSFICLSAGPRTFFLHPSTIPLISWVFYTAFFVTVNLLNNWAFAYRISVPLHIILRSGGPVASITIGYLFNGKRYSQGQVLAVVMLTLGVVSAALADARAKGQEIPAGKNQDEVSMSGTLLGFTILALAMILSAFQGIYADRLYETYGRNHWKEALFYSHLLSLPLFIPTFPHLSAQFQSMASSPSLLSAVDQYFTGRDVLASYPASSATSARSNVVNIANHLIATWEWNDVFRSILASIPVQVVYLMLNALTQYVCIRGVHLLSAKSSSLTVTVVLNIRKLVSLLLSIYIFGNDLTPGVLAGAFFVFVGGALYGFEGTRMRTKVIKKD